MTLAARLFQRPKVGEAVAEIQDAAAVEPARGLAAIADGATDAAFQRLWADLLVAGWVAQPPGGERGPEVEEWLAELRRAWQSRVPWERLPWHGAMKAQETGGLATFLGVCVEPAASGQWTVAALAVGDCGLLVLDGNGDLRQAWPMDDPAAFAHTPPLLSSLLGLPADAWERGLLLDTEVPLATGERLLLATDAALQWLLRLAAEGASLLADVCMLLETAATPLCGGESEPPPAFVAQVADAAIASARAAGMLRNDDVTVLFLTPEPP